MQRIAFRVASTGIGPSPFVPSAGNLELDTLRQQLCPEYFNSFNSGPPEYVKSKWIFTYDSRPYPFASLSAPHWFVALLAVGISILPWLRWRFSLRTLLIATTLVAVVLGVVVWLR